MTARQILWHLRSATDVIVMLHFSCNQLCSFIIPYAWDGFWYKLSSSSKGWELYVVLHSTLISVIWSTSSHADTFLALSYSMPSQHMTVHSSNKMLNPVLQVKFCFQLHLSSSFECHVAPRWKLGTGWSLQVCEQALEPARWRSWLSTLLLISLGARHYLLFQ